MAGGGKWDQRPFFRLFVSLLHQVGAPRDLTVWYPMDPAGSH